MSDDFGIVRGAMICDAHTGDDCPCLLWAPDAHAAIDRIEARVEELQRDVELLAVEKRDCAELVRQHAGQVVELQRERDEWARDMADENRMVEEARLQRDRQRERAEAAERERDGFQKQGSEWAYKAGRWEHRVGVLEAALRDIADEWPKGAGAIARRALGEEMRVSLLGDE